MGFCVKELGFNGIFSGLLGYNDTKKYKVGGCDLGFPLYDSTCDTLYLLFGDSFQENNFSYDWRSNTMCQIKEITDNGRIIVDHFLNSLENKAYVLSEGHHVDEYEMTRIPTGAVEINGIFYFYYFSMCSWNYSKDKMMNMGGLVKSLDKGQTWIKVNEISFLNDLEKPSAVELLNEDNLQKPLKDKINPEKKLNHYFTQIFPKIEGDYVYLFAEGEYRNQPLHMGRVKKEFIENYDEYEYLIAYENKKPIYQKGDEARRLMHEGKCVHVCPAAMGEMSVIFNPYLNKYCLFIVSDSPNVLNETKDHGLFMYYSDCIDGPYDEYIKICDYDDPRLNIEGMYAPMTHEKMMKNDGQDIYLLLSQWIPLYNPITVHIKFTKDEI